MTDAQAAALVSGERVYVPIPQSVRIETGTVSHQPIGLSAVPSLGSFGNVEVAGKIETLRSEHIFLDGRDAILASVTATWHR